jgi:proline iminopeptidase
MHISLILLYSTASSILERITMFTTQKPRLNNMAMKLYQLANVRTKEVIVNHKPYKVTITGTGKIPCFCLGIGMLMQRTFSEKFRSMFTVYSADLYWSQHNKLDKPTELTMNKLVDDIHSVTTQLELDKPVLVAHSAYGIVGLEVAKRDNANLSGLIMVASPPACNEHTMKFAEDYFRHKATPERIANHEERKRNYVRQAGECEVSVGGYAADSAKYWADFNISREFLDNLWAGVEADDAIFNHFFGKLLPEHNINENMHKVKAPIVLAGGHLDFDSAPLAQWNESVYQKPGNFTVIDCGDVGHWPNLENESQPFDAKIAEWLEQQLKIALNHDSEKVVDAASQMSMGGRK